MSDAQSHPFVELTITPPTDLEFILDAMEAREELGRPFLIMLDVSSSKPKGDLHGLLGRSATVALTHPKKAKRWFNGVVGRISYRGLDGGAYRYRLELRPWIWLLSHKQDCRIFSGKSPWQIMTQLFRDGGFSDFSDKRQNGSGDAVLDYCVQYRESTFDFVTRLMEQYGIYYFVKHSEGSHSIVFADDTNSHVASSGSIPYAYDQTAWKQAEDHVWNWSVEARIQPGSYSLRDYNFTTPRADLTARFRIAGQHSHGAQEVYDYPGIYETADAGRAAAQVRMQDIEARRQVCGAMTNSRELTAGAKFRLSDFPDGPANGEYLVVSSVCTVERGEARSFEEGDEIVDTFQCELTALWGRLTFRLPAVTPTPLIRGPQTAVVTGESGQEVTTDEHGRIKVQFPWDRLGTMDENSSCWIRVAQIWAGASWGGMFIPRIGQEVVVEFLEGNPDRPLVTGRVYNADQTVPYALPANKTRSTIKSNSSQGGGGFNELRFEDKKGEEEVFFQAQKDYNVVVLNNHTATITKDTTTTVKEGNRSVTISKGDDTLLVSKGNRKTTVDAGDDTTAVTQGNHKLTVSAGASIVEAMQKITLKVGGSSIEMTPEGITLKAVKISVTGDAQVEASAPAVSVSGDATLELKGGATATLKAAMVAIN